MNERQLRNPVRQANLFMLQVTAIKLKTDLEQAVWDQYLLEHSIVVLLAAVSHQWVTQFIDDFAFDRFLVLTIVKFKMHPNNSIK